MFYRTTIRNYDNIEFDEIRRAIDDKYNQAHDELSRAYYEKKPFVWRGKDYGILDKDTFDKLHGLIFLKRDVEFHEYNISLPPDKRIDEKKYNYIIDKKNNIIIGKKDEIARQEIANLKNLNIDIDI